jgi:hypothetical protein
MREEVAGRAPIGEGRSRWRSPGRTEGLPVGLLGHGESSGRTEGRAGQPRGTTAMGWTSKGKPAISASSSAKTRGRVVRAAPRPRAPAARSMFWVAGKIEAARTRRSPRRVSPPTTMRTGACGDAPLSPLIDLVEQRFGEPSFGMGLGPALPGPAVQVSDGRPACRGLGPPRRPRAACSRRWERRCRPGGPVPPRSSPSGSGAKDCGRRAGGGRRRRIRASGPPVGQHGADRRRRRRTGRVNVRR